MGNILGMSRDRRHYTQNKYDVAIVASSLANCRANNPTHIIRTAHGNNVDMYTSYKPVYNKVWWPTLDHCYCSSIFYVDILSHSTQPT